MALSEKQCLYMIESASLPITVTFSTFCLVACHIFRFVCFRKRLARSSTFSFKFYFVFGIIQFPLGLIDAIILPHCPPGCACTDPWQALLVSNTKRYLELFTGVYLLLLAGCYYRKVKHRVRKRASPGRAAGYKSVSVDEELGGVLDW